MLKITLLLGCESYITKQKIIYKWDLLVNELQPSTLVDKYVAEKLLPESEGRKILADPERRRQVHYLLCDIIRSDRNEYVTGFLSMLEQTGNVSILNKLGTLNQLEFHEKAGNTLYVFCPPYGDFVLFLSG